MILLDERVRVWIGSLRGVLAGVSERVTEVEQDLGAWLDEATRLGASDLHLAAGHPPTVRVHGQLSHLAGQPSFDGIQTDAIMELCSADDAKTFKKRNNLDFAFDKDVGGALRRFRANYFVSGDEFGACFRVIPETIPAFDWAGFPEGLANRLAHFRNGLVLVAGMTGAGKTTTLAMLVDLLNQEGGYRIVTIEDPVEYRFPHATNSIVTQREVGRDVDSFADGLRFGLRQDPDVILVGEVRDRETAQMALSAAETGHLVLSTLHTRDAKGAISRFSDLFPQSTQPEIRSQLAMSLRAVVSQHLLPSADGGKQKLALEILFNSNPIAAGIRTGKLETIDTGIVTGRNDGMQSLDESIKQLFLSGEISLETAERFVSNPGVLRP